MTSATRFSAEADVAKPSANHDATAAIFQIFPSKAPGI
jgi:hypothetical protein